MAWLACDKRKRRWRVDVDSRSLNERKKKKKKIIIKINKNKTNGNRIRTRRNGEKRVARCDKLVRILVTSAVVRGPMRQTGGADSVVSRVHVGKESGYSDRLCLGELEAVGDAARESGTRGRGRAARLSTTTCTIPLSKTRRCRLADQRIASTLNPASRPSYRQLPQRSSPSSSSSSYSTYSSTSSHSFVSPSTNLFRVAPTVARHSGTS